MFSLFYGLWKYMFSKIEFHALILGIEKAGKTKLKSIYTNLEGIPPDRIVPTVGLNIGHIEAPNAKLVFWDLGGQIGLRTIWEKYYEEAHAVIYAIDASNASSPSSFEDSKSALEKVLRHQDLRGASLLILVNKQNEIESTKKRQKLKANASGHDGVTGIEDFETDTKSLQFGPDTKSRCRAISSILSVKQVKIG